MVSHMGLLMGLTTARPFSCFEAWPKNVNKKSLPLGIANGVRSSCTLIRRGLENGK